MLLLRQEYFKVAVDKPPPTAEWFAPTIAVADLNPKEVGPGTPGKPDEPHSPAQRRRIAAHAERRFAFAERRTTTPPLRLAQRSKHHVSRDSLGAQRSLPIIRALPNSIRFTSDPI